MFERAHCHIIYMGELVVFCAPSAHRQELPAGSHLARNFVLSARRFVVQSSIRIRIRIRAFQGAELTFSESVTTPKIHCAISELTATVAQRPVRCSLRSA